MSATEVRRDIYGNMIDWVATGRRRIDGLGSMRAEMRQDGSHSWMYCRPHEDCASCAAKVDHDGCLLDATPSNTESNEEKGNG